MRAPIRPVGPLPARTPNARQIEVLAAIVDAGSYKEAAGRLELSVATVKRHMAELRLATGLTTIQAAFALRHELALMLATHDPWPGSRP